MNKPLLRPVVSTALVLVLVLSSISAVLTLNPAFAQGEEYVINIINIRSHL